LSVRSPGHVRQRLKVFWFFFSKKNILPYAAFAGASFGINRWLSSLISARKSAAPGHAGIDSAALPVSARK
jgi:hypothetical protein